MEIFSFFLCLTLTFVFAFLKQLFSAAAFVLKKENTTRHIFNLPKKKAFVKKKYELLRVIPKRAVQSRPFFAKFLYGKEFYRTSLSTKFLIDKIYRRLSLNQTLLSSEIDFNKIGHAGFDLKKPTMIFDVSRYTQDALEEAISEVMKRTSFQPILVSDSKLETSLKQISPLDINLKLYEELSKLDLNYNSNYCFEAPKTESDIACSSEFAIQRFYSKGNLSYRIIPKTCGKLTIALAQKNFYFNFYINKNNLKIVSPFGEETSFVSNQKISKAYKINHMGKGFLCVDFNIKKNLDLLFFNLENIENYKKIILEDKINKNKLFNLKIYTKNKRFNDFFNINLRKKLVDELYSKNYLRQKKVEINRKFISEFLKLDYKTLVSNSKSYSEFYNFLLKQVFGVVVKEEKLLISPNIQVPFKICLYYNGEDKQIYCGDFTGGRKIESLSLKNISVIDLQSLKKPVFLIS